MTNKKTFTKIRKWAEKNGYEVVDSEFFVQITVYINKKLSFSISQEESTISRSHRGKLQGRAKGMYMGRNDERRIGYQFQYRSQQNMIEDMETEITRAEERESKCEAEKSLTEEVTIIKEKAVAEEGITSKEGELNKQAIENEIQSKKEKGGVKLTRINKTENNLQTVWQQLDNASGELYNALDNLHHMTGLSEETKRLMNSVDVGQIDLLKSVVEQLIENKKQLSFKEAQELVRSELKRKEFNGEVYVYEDIEDYCMWNSIDLDLLDWESTVRNWDKQPSEEDVKNGFIVCEIKDEICVLYSFDKPSIEKFIEIVID